MRYIAQTFGARLKAFRGVKALRDLALDAGISPEQLSGYETGKNQPTLVALLALQSALGLQSLEHLLGEVDSPLMPSRRMWAEATGVAAE